MAVGIRLESADTSREELRELLEEPGCDEASATRLDLPEQ